MRKNDRDRKSAIMQFVVGVLAFGAFFSLSENALCDDPVVPIRPGLLSTVPVRWSMGTTHPSQPRSTRESPLAAVVFLTDDFRRTGSMELFRSYRAMGQVLASVVEHWLIQRSGRVLVVAPSSLLPVKDRPDLTREQNREYHFRKIEDFVWDWLQIAPPSDSLGLPLDSNQYIVSPLSLRNQRDVLIVDTSGPKEANELHQFIAAKTLAEVVADLAKMGQIQIDQNTTIVDWSLKNLEEIALQAERSVEAPQETRIVEANKLGASSLGLLAPYLDGNFGAAAMAVAGFSIEQAFRLDSLARSRDLLPQINPIQERVKNMTCASLTAER